MNAITNHIDMIFAPINIYNETIKQGFLTPCFCVNYIKTQEKQFLASRHKLFNRIEITYFPENGIEECSEILDKLYSNLSKINFDGRTIEGINMEGYIEKGLVKFYIDYDFYIFRKEKKEKMQKLFIK